MSFQDTASLVSACHHLQKLHKCLILRFHFVLQSLQLKKEVKEMLDFAQAYMLKVRSPNEENSDLTKQENMAPDEVPGDQ